MGGAVKWLVLLAVVCLASLGGVIYLAQAVEAPVAPVEKVLPNDMFPK